MLAEVRAFIRREGLLEPEEPVLVAVSGGVDSMVLLHVLGSLGHPCTVVHVDHGLRGIESDGDREWVEDHCRSKRIPFRSFTVNVKERRDPTGSSVQVVARDLRYEAFKEALKDGPRVLAMGHHQDDAVETLLMDLMRGVRLNGWAGIRPMTDATGVADGRFIRPLLNVTREQIIAYATGHAIAFREDSSNADVKYLRNRVRHDLVPHLERIQPGVVRVLARSVEVLREMSLAAGKQLEMERAAATSVSNGPLRIPFTSLEASLMPNLLLAALLPSHLHPDVIARIRQAVDDRSTGATFFAATKRIIVDREALLIDEHVGPYPEYVVGAEQGSPGPFSWGFINVEGSGRPHAMHEAWLDPERLRFPMTLRPWREGDRMRPLGMKGSKLISDVLIDAKVPMVRKASTYVLLQGDEVIWLAGHRIAEGAQATMNATKAWRIIEHHVPDPGA